MNIAPVYDGTFPCYRLRGFPTFVSDLFLAVPTRCVTAALDFHQVTLERTLITDAKIELAPFIYERSGLLVHSALLESPYRRGEAAHNAAVVPTAMIGRHQLIPVCNIELHAWIWAYDVLGSFT